MSPLSSFLDSNHLAKPFPQIVAEQKNQFLLENASNINKSTLPITPPYEFDEAFTFGLPQSQDLKPVGVLEDPVVAVLGVGYVGFHLVKAFAPLYSVIAFDISEKRLLSIANQLREYPSISWTSDAKHLANATHFLIAVPTLLLPDKSIDTSYLRSAINTINTYARPGATVVVESSVAVGMTRQLLAPLMHSRGLKAGMSPERVDPGRTEPPMESIPKIISGLDDITPGSLESIKKLYSRVFQEVVTVSKPEVAEMMKLYENCQRMVCIAYANEMADACVRVGIDPYEVGSAAATKPFGYMPFSPSLGVGGPCIPVNPYYLLSNNEFPLLQAATEKMWQRPEVIADSAMAELKALNPGKFANTRPRVLVCGVGFKRGQSLTSFSPGVSMIERLHERWDSEVCYADPLVDQSVLPSVQRLNEETEWNKSSLEKFDLIVVNFRQDGLDFSLLDELKGVNIQKWCL